MGKKKFINKKNSATFQLFARDSSSSSAAPPADHAADADRVFVRVDANNHYRGPDSFADDVIEDDLDPYSVFTDAPDDGQFGSAPLPDHVRREILELGFPDDGYNYLAHLREIRKAGAGSNYYQNSKAKVEGLPLDVRAYDASRLRVTAETSGADAFSVCDVAAGTVAVKVDRVLDLEVVGLLEDGDLSRFGSDVEDLEEDFVARANCVEEFGEDEGPVPGQVPESSAVERDGELGIGDGPRQRRPLDEQFDLLMLNEYGDDSESDGDYHEETKYDDALKDFPQEKLNFQDKYIAPADFLRQDQSEINGELFESSADILQKCAEYAEMYEQEDDNKEDVVIYQESSEESEIWDCETIVSTYSNLDNHPGRIEAPGKPRKARRFPALDSAVSGEMNKLIALGGREMMPVDFLPRSRRTLAEKEKRSATVLSDQLKRRPDESKEEKKERKAAVKEARKEARIAKKQLKEVYKCESQLAQKVAAISGPSSIRLM